MVFVFRHLAYFTSHGALQLKIEYFFPFKFIFSPFAVKGSHTRVKVQVASFPDVSWDSVESRLGGRGLTGGRTQTCSGARLPRGRAQVAAAAWVPGGLVSQGEQDKRQWLPSGRRRPRGDGRVSGPRAQPPTLPFCAPTLVSYVH